jgi:hypothetical protein
LHAVGLLLPRSARRPPSAQAACAQSSSAAPSSGAAGLPRGATSHVCHGAPRRTSATGRHVARLPRGAASHIPKAVGASTANARAHPRTHTRAHTRARAHACMYKHTTTIGAPAWAGGCVAYRARLRVRGASAPRRPWRASAHPASCTARAVALLRAATPRAARCARRVACGALRVACGVLRAACGVLCVAAAAFRAVRRRVARRRTVWDSSVISPTIVERVGASRAPAAAGGHTPAAAGGHTPGLGACARAATQLRRATGARGAAAAHVADNVSTRCRPF